MRRIAYEATSGPLGRFATVLLTAIPTLDAVLTARQWHERVARYYGKASPACNTVLGQRVKGPSTPVIDAYGAVIESTALPGDGWRTYHDIVKHSIAMAAYAMHVNIDVEVFNLFADLFSPTAIREINKAGARHRQGIVPDFRIPRLLASWDERLAELKHINLSATNYPLQSSTHNRHANEACAARAVKIQREYNKHAKKLDKT